MTLNPSLPTNHTSNTMSQSENILSLRDIASWQFPKLARDLPQGRPPMVAAIPSLQRGAVWRPNQVELLWDSILRGFPIGSLVVTPLLKPQKSRGGAHVLKPQKSCGGAHVDNLPWGDDAYTHHLLDGQQRVNAIALGYLDPPFASTASKQVEPHTLLWLDLAPQGAEPLSLGSVKGFESSTRSYLLRVTTQAHPWGFKVSDEKEPTRLEHWQAREAKAIFLGTQGDTHDRPLPHQGWPIAANAPIPLAWALEAAHKVAATTAPERALWEAVFQRCAAYSPQAVTTEADKCFKPWAPRAVCVLKYWLGTETLCLQALHLARALLRAIQARMVALPIAPEALEEPYRLTGSTETSAQEDIVPIANVEHLFQRLNGGGTDLSPEDRAYSMIKAYWPGIESTIQDISPRPPEIQVALLGTRLSLDLAEGKNTLPAQPSVNSLRQLATVQADGSKKAHELMAQRQQIRTMFGLLDAEDADAPPIHKAIKQWDRWFLYSQDQPWGLPPVLRSRMASHAPEVFLFLLRLAHHTGTPDETVRRKLLGLATALHWFGMDRERAVRWLWAVPPAQWLDGSNLSNVLSRIRYSDQDSDPNKPTIARIMTPEELDVYIDPGTIRSGHIADWRWWDSLVVKPAHQAALSRNPAAGQEDLNKAVNDRWAEYEHFIDIMKRQDYRGTNALLLMYAQREQMQHLFPDYDPQDADFWAAHNVPWDFDHLLQQNAFTDRRVGNDFMWVCKEWGNTIANLHLLPFEQNRSRQDEELKNILPTDTAEQVDFLRRMHVAPDTAAPDTAAEANRLSAFSMHSDAIRSNSENLKNAERCVTDFVLASRERLLRLYSDWFNTLQIGSLLKIEKNPP